MMWNSNNTLQLQASEKKKKKKRNKRYKKIYSCEPPTDSNGLRHGIASHLYLASSHDCFRYEF